ncbi:MAG: hypothetical protein ABSD98_06315 [Candidatus Korobacteraceae bacterium]
MPQKSKENNQNLTLKTGKLTGWAMALDRAHSHLAKNRTQAAKLRAAIRLFEEKLSSGEPWPGDAVFRQKGEFLGKRRLLGKAMSTMRNTTISRNRLITQVI